LRFFLVEQFQLDQFAGTPLLPAGIAEPEDPLAQDFLVSSAVWQGFSAAGAATGDIRHGPDLRL
jgi:hypothetical protein